MKGNERRKSARKAQDLIRIIEEIRADPEAMKQVRQLIAAR